MCRYRKKGTMDRFSNYIYRMLFVDFGENGSKICIRRIWIGLILQANALRNGILIFVYYLLFLLRFFVNIEGALLTFSIEQSSNIILLKMYLLCPLFTLVNCFPVVFCQTIQYRCSFSLLTLNWKVN